jgi:hypothetical protein
MASAKYRLSARTGGESPGFPRSEFLSCRVVSICCVGFNRVGELIMQFFCRFFALAVWLGAALAYAADADTVAGAQAAIKRAAYVVGADKATADELARRKDVILNDPQENTYEARVYRLRTRQLTRFGYDVMRQSAGAKVSDVSLRAGFSGASVNPAAGFELVLRW